MADVKFIGVRMPQEMVSKMDRVLAAESMGITEYIRGLVRADLRNRGMLDDAAEENQSPTHPAAAGA